MTDNQTLAEYDPGEVKRAAKLALYNQDLDLFCRRELKIVTKNIGLVPLALYNWQRNIAISMAAQLKRLGRIRQLWFKCRQPGGTTFASATISRLVFLNPYVNAFVCAQDKTTVGTIFGIYNTFYENLNEEIRPMRQYFTKGTEIYFGNPNHRFRDDDPGLRSRIIVGEAKNVNVGTGQTLHAVHLSEIARMATVQGIKDSLIPAFSDGPGTVGIYESTAHWALGADMWKSMCERARRGEGEWEYHFIGWWKQNEYSIPMKAGEIYKADIEERHLLKQYSDLTLENLKWRKKKIEDLDGDLFTFRMSYPFTFEEAWIPHGHSCFPTDRLIKMKEDLRPPKRVCEFDPGGRLHDDPELGHLSIWHEPKQGMDYDIGADVAEGLDEGDYTVAEVIERGTNRQVAEWRGHIDTYEFGDILYHLGMYYNTAQIAPEIEKYGLQVVVRLQELVYPNLHIWQKRDQIVPKYTNLFGWSTTNNSKLILVSLARHLIWNSEMTVYSEVLWDELMNYVRDVTPTGLHTYRAGPDAHDDCVMSWMIALRVSRDESAIRMEGEMFGKHEKIEEKYRDPSTYDFEGLKPVGVHTAISETEPW